MNPETHGKLKYGVWGLVFGAVIATIIGFVWGGWTTSGETKRMTEKAVLASHAAICVAQFMKDPNHVEKLKEFEKVVSYERPKFIEKGGWAKMPGGEKPDYAACRACADGLELLINKK
jgi:hypothetical protein